MTLKKTVKHMMLSTDYGRRLFFVKNKRSKEKAQGKKVDNRWKYLLKNITKPCIFTGNNSAEAIANMLDEIPIYINKGDTFFYHLEENVTWDHRNWLFGNTTVDYTLLLNRSLNDLFLDGSDDYTKKNNTLIKAWIDYLHRVCKGFEQYGECGKIKSALECIEREHARTFYDALQRILFQNQLLWQTGHPLNGLGNLDKLLYPLYKNDIDSKRLDYDLAKKYVKEFCIILHRYYEMKSGMLLGDTGQIIVLGYSDASGEYHYNELTELFIDVIQELKLPDPKILLRVNRNIPDGLLAKAVDCISTGIGSPLLANDEKIIPAMINFGYNVEDACNYVVAACWEPMVAGKSYDLNNIISFNFAAPLIKLMSEKVSYKNYDSLFDRYLINLDEYIDGFIANYKRFPYNEDIVMSLFNGCSVNHKDITEGGAIYNNIGFTSTGLGCVINSLMNLKKYVFDNNVYKIKTIYDAIDNNFADNETLQKAFLDNEDKYGKDNTEIITITKLIVDRVNKRMDGKYGELGGKFKFGVSAPSYIDLGKKSPATPDGRKAGMPFTPHISCADGIAYTELMQFAAKLDYTGHRFNGNVVDFMVTPSFLKKNRDKFVLFLKQSIELGFYEMQMNVVDSKTLIEARKNPAAFPNLIVRVWGFSAYFKDLPDEYKDLLINRAIKAEQVA